jgi:uncharacterized protein YhbP (UPF0306 family)
LIYQTRTVAVGGGRALSEQIGLSRNEPDRQIVARLLESHFYRISPKWIRLIDNSKGFGHKEEMIF